MKGILQMYDVEANVGYDRAEQDARDRSKSLGARSAGARSPEPRSVPVLAVAESQPFLANRGLNDSFQTEKRDGTLKAIQDSQLKAQAHDMEMRFENQDRMINYLLAQMQAQEGTAMKSLRQANDLNEKDREAMQKRSLDLKLSFDNANA